MKKEKDYEAFERAIDEANSVKYRMWEIAEKLDEAGFHRKAQSARRFVYEIEAWQHRR